MTIQLLETASKKHNAFQNAWKDASHDPRAKSTLTHYTVNVLGENAISTARVKGWLKASHHVLFNIINHKPIDSGFTNITNCNKLQYSRIAPNEGLVHAIAELGRIQKIARNIYDVKPVTGYIARRLSDFLEPLNNTISLDDLMAIKIPDIAYNKV